MKKSFFLSAGLLLAAAAGYFFYQQNKIDPTDTPVAKPEQLANEIIAGISIPFSKYDAIALNDGYRCGNAPREKGFSIFLLEDKYMNALKDRFKIDVMEINAYQTAFTKAKEQMANPSFNAEMEGMPGPLNGVIITIETTQINPKEVRVVETYSLADSIKMVKKDYRFDVGKWRR